MLWLVLAFFRKLQNQWFFSYLTWFSLLLQAIFALGMAIFKALDFGSNPGEEIALSSDLEALITLMTNCGTSGK